MPCVAAIAITFLAAACGNLTPEGASCDSVELCPIGYFCDPGGHCSSAAPITDSGFVDAGALDSGMHDAGSIDSGPSDSGPMDAGTTDSGPTDAGTQDAGTTDAGTSDAGHHDAGSNADAGPTICMSNADCSGSTPACIDSTGQCVECVTSADCTGTADTCDNDNQCIPTQTCVEVTECTNPHASVCSAYGVCVGCQVESDCSMGEFCNASDTCQPGPTPADAGMFDAGSVTYCNDGMSMDGGNIGCINCGKGLACAFNGKCAVPRYSASNGVVTDAVTNLHWQQVVDAMPCPSDGGAGHCGWTEASLYCVLLSLNGSGWRLPSLPELYSIVDIQGTPPNLDPVFSGTSSNFYWTSTPAVGMSSYAWFVNFGGGVNVDTGPESTPYPVRCVR